MEEGGVYNHRRAYRRYRRHHEQYGSMEEGEAYLELEDYPQEHPQETGELEPEIVPGQYTKTGAPKEHFGHGHLARHEAGKKGAEISIGERTEEQLKEAARKAARTRAERYGQHLHVSDPSKDDLLGVPTKVVDTDPPAKGAEEEEGGPFCG